LIRGKKEREEKGKILHLHRLSTKKKKGRGEHPSNAADWKTSKKGARRRRRIISRGERSSERRVKKGLSREISCRKKEKYNRNLCTHHESAERKAHKKKRESWEGGV